MKNNLTREFQYYLEHQEELVGLHEGKYIVIRNEAVIGVFDSELAAIQETAKKHAMGSFLVQRCELGQESYTQVFHSRVAFV